VPTEPAAGVEAGSAMRAIVACPDQGIVKRLDRKSEPKGRHPA
jgi:hypothetical protein